MKKAFRNKINGIAFTAIFVLLVLTIGLGIGMFRLTAKINTINHQVIEVNQSITCSQIWHDGENNKNSCIGLQDNLTDIKSELDDVQNTVNGIPQ